MKKPEILSPAGDFDKLKTAIMYGADAVYLAGDEFGMRTASKNFEEDELVRAVALAKQHGVHVYVTLNTMPRSDEVERMPLYLERLDSAGIDAVIVADIGVMRTVQKVAPRLDIHVSTQASVVNYVSARTWHELGASRIVLARELSLEEIATIRAKTSSKLELEAFVHGAMCMSYSGRCLLSSFMAGRDANRGNCAQPCRWKYSLVEELRPGEYYDIFEDNGSYILNSKDLCMIQHIPELVSAGIDSFKIEGRVKTEYYNATITNAYRMALDAYFKSPEIWDRNGIWTTEVQKVSHREYYTGFYFNGTDGQHYENSSYIRDWDVAAIVLECDTDGLATVTQRNRFFAEDTLEILEPNVAPTMVSAKTMTDMKGTALTVAPHAKMELKIKLPHQVPTGTFLRREKL